MEINLLKELKEKGMENVLKENGLKKVELSKEMNSEYVQVVDSDDRTVFYILEIEGRLVDVTNDFSRAVDLDVYLKPIDDLLENNLKGEKSYVNK